MIVVHSVGPYAGIEVYWGVDRDLEPTDQKVVSYAWLVEDLPPFRKSKWGLRVKIGSRALHLGLCNRGEDPYRRGIAPIDEISEWRRPHGVSAAGQEGAIASGPEPLGSALPGGPLPGPGVSVGNSDPSDRPVPAGAGQPAPDLGPVGD